MSFVCLCNNIVRVHGMQIRFLIHTNLSLIEDDIALLNNICSQRSPDTIEIICLFIYLFVIERLTICTYFKLDPSNLTVTYMMNQSLFMNG